MLIYCINVEFVMNAGSVSKHFGSFESLGKILYFDAVSYLEPSASL
jgi:hypothetical protein